MRRPVVLVIGVGGIGGPAALALSDRTDVALRLVDPDLVDVSNLSRQILFCDADVGRPKARVGAARLAARGVRVEGIVDRMDASTAARLFEGVAVAIDATDGAAAKDWANALAIEAGVPLVHAAALSSEGRVLEGPAGGRPCIACLFGYPSESGETAGDTCARVGVWPCVPGAIGALAAHAALARIANSAVKSNGLQVLDFAVPRALSLAAAADTACPACGSARRRPQSVPDVCRAATTSARDVAPDGVLDLRTESCPMNLLRARRAIDARPAGERLEIWVGAEGAETVPSGLSTLGHAIESIERDGDGLALVVRRRGGASPAAASDEAWIARFARQIVLDDLGEAGQRRIAAREVVVEGEGAAAETAAIHLTAAGAGHVALRASAVSGMLTLRTGADRLARRVRDRGALARFEGAVAADQLLRTIVSGVAPSVTVEVDDRGVVQTILQAT